MAPPLHFKSNRKPSSHEVAQKFTANLLSHNSYLFAQHIPGNKNGIADSLSRDINLSPQALTNHLLTTFTSQVPDNFQLLRLEDRIISWIESVLRRSTVTTESRKQQGRNKPAISIGGRTSSEDATSPIRSSPTSQRKNEARLCAHSRAKCKIIDLTKRLSVPFEAVPLMPPSQMWSQPFERTTSPTP